MDLSIVVPTHSRPDHLARLLGSLEAATAPGLSWEVIVIENAVSFGVAPALARALDRPALPLRRFAEPAQGKSRALNLGVRRARGEFVAFLDDDVIARPDYLAGVRETIRTLPHSVYGGRVRAVWPAPPPDWVTGGGPVTISRGPIVAHDHGDHARAYDAGMALPIGCNFFCRLDLFARCGLFDVRLGPGSGKGHMGGEETDLLHRFQAAGETIFYAPRVAVDHPVDPERMTKRYFRFRHFCAGRAAPYLVSARFPSILGVPRFLYRRLARAAGRAALLRAAGRRLPAFDRELEVCELLGAMYEYRRVSRGAA